MNRGISIGTIIVVMVLLTCTVAASFVTLGVGAFGPTNIIDAEITKTYVDYSGSKEEQESHYMVATDQGTYEVTNSLLLNIWNADEIYGRLQANKRYRLTTRGNKVVNMFFQEYPYITVVEALPEKIRQDTGLKITEDAK